MIKALFVMTACQKVFNILHDYKTLHGSKHIFLFRQEGLEFIIWQHVSASHPKTIHAIQGTNTTIFTE